MVCKQLEKHTLKCMVTFLTYISNACHSLLGVAERLQHTLKCRLLKLYQQRLSLFVRGGRAAPTYPEV